MDACANGVRFSLLYDGRCLTAEPGLGCGVALAACAAAGEANATLQTWRLEPNKNGTSFTVYSPAKSETTATPCPEDASPECPAWARLGECEKNAVYMTHACRRACGLCHPKPICSVWSHRTPVPGSAADSAELKLLVRAPKAPFLWLAPRGSEKRHLRVQLQAWSSMFPDYKLARVRCPGMAQAACCLEAGLWGLGHRNAHVQRASLQLCSYHESHMFPFQEWRVECAPDAAEGDAAEEQREGQPEPTAAWLEGLARDEGEEALERLLPHELLGVGEFSPVEAAKAPRPQLLPRPRTHTLAPTRQCSHALAPTPSQPHAPSHRRQPSGGWAATSTRTRAPRRTARSSSTSCVPPSTSSSRAAGARRKTTTIAAASSPTRRWSSSTARPTPPPQRARDRSGWCSTSRRGATSASQTRPTTPSPAAGVRASMSLLGAFL